jgi:hypothetical protein
MRIYQHSGAVPAGGAAMALAAGAIAAAVLGIVYSFTFYYIPYVYLNFLLVVAFGLGTGYVVGFAAREGNIRNVVAVGTIALIAAAVGIYAEWGSTVYAMCPPLELPLLWAKLGLFSFLPQNIVVVMLDLFAEGSWGMTANSTVHGWPLVVLWIVEAGLITSIAIGTAVKQVANVPFCEACQKWVSSHSPHFYAGDGSESVWSEVQQGTFETLALTPRATTGEPTYVRLALATCDGCSDSNFLTITVCRNTVDNKGNPRLEETNLVSNLILEPVQVDIIQAANVIAPAAGEGPLPAIQLPQGAGNWTLQQANQATVPLTPAGKS